MLAAGAGDRTRIPRCRRATVEPGTSRAGPGAVGASAAMTSGSSACGVAAGADGGMACGGSSRPKGTSQPNRLRRRQATTRPLRSARGAYRVSELSLPAPSGGSQGVVGQRTTFTTQRESQ